MRHTLIALCLALLPIASMGQTLEDAMNILVDEEQADEEQWEAQMEELAQLHAEPLDINTATRTDLRRIPLLSEEQIEEILTYVFLNTGFRSLAELQTIESLDYVTRQLLPLFLYAGNTLFERRDTITLRRLMREAKHELVTRLDIPFYYRKGYSYSPDDGGYNGSALYSRVQYKLTSLRHLQIGLTAEKDQGEPFSGNGGFDHYSAHFLLKDIKRLRTLAIGDYKLGFGEGLVVNNGFSVGKMMSLRTTQGIRANTSADEYNFFRGIAASVNLTPTLTLTAWASGKPMDATLNADSTAKTIVTSGYHRTNTELAKKHNLTSLTAGGNISWAGHKGITLGATGYWQHFSRALAPGTATYRTYYPAGTTFANLGLNYGWRNQWLAFAGETAFSTAHNGIATLARATVRLSTNLRLMGIGRYYQKGYYSFYATALCENSTVQNESGGMLMIEAQPTARWTATAYADYFRNPWPRYGLTHSSQGVDIVSTNDITLATKHTLTLRAQLKRKEASDTMLTHIKFKLTYSAQLSALTRLQTRLATHTVSGGTGFAISEAVRHTFRHQRGEVHTNLAYVRTPAYSQRVYLGEPTLRGTFSYPSLYGHALRSASTCTYRLWHSRLSLEGKFAVTRWFDRTEQSSGMQTIFSAWKSDASVQLRLRL